jgi:predicted transcriptional regulator
MVLRTKVEIIYQILKIAQTGEIKTKIMYKASLSYEGIKHYLSTMTEAGLLQYDEGDNLYRTTERGLQFEEAYEHLVRLLSQSLAN